MNNLTLFTSGSTKEPKEIKHSWLHIEEYALKSINESKLSPSDIVLDVFPSNVIAHWTITAYPARKVGAELISTNFDPFTYIKLFQKYQPTFISLIPRHYEILKRTKGFKNLDMSCVRYMVTGSSPITQEFIDAFTQRGVQTVANWYGMTECPPPIMVGYNTPYFTKVDDNVIFTRSGECVINGFYTGDIFDKDNNDRLFFKQRLNNADRKTWKNNF